MPRFPIDEVQTNARMRASAQSVLEAHGIIEPPVNVYQILKDEKIPVDFVNFKSSKTEGMYVCDVTGIGIAINANHHPVKKRFTGAHELKHHRHDTPGVFCKTDYRRREIEQKANRFAAELLIPPHMMQTVIKELYDQELLTVTTLASVFHVSYETAVFRLHTLGYIGDGQRDTLLKPAERQNDKLQALATQNSDRAAHLRTGAVIAVFSSHNSFSYCQKCSSVIVDQRWNICHSCGCDFV